MASSLFTEVRETGTNSADSRRLQGSSFKKAGMYPRLEGAFLSSTTKIETAVLRESTCYEKIQITVSRKSSGVCAW